MKVRTLLWSRGRKGSNATIQVSGGAFTWGRDLVKVGNKVKFRVENVNDAAPVTALVVQK